MLLSTETHLDLNDRQLKIEKKNKDEMKSFIEEEVSENENLLKEKLLQTE